jgi:Domain of unknown function (DUF397)
MKDEDLSGAVWCKASLSSGSGGNCVEVASNLHGIVAVRDSKNPTGPALVITRGDWQSFVAMLKGTER